MLKKMKIIRTILLILLLIPSFVGCSSAQGTDSTTSLSTSSSTSITTANDSMIDTSTLFTDRDLAQTVDLSKAISMPLTSNEDITISEAGIYVLYGTAENTTVIVDVASDAKVQLVLDGVNVTNTDAPAIYVKAADKVFVTTTDSTNSMAVSGTFIPDGTTNLDAVVFSKTDLVFNGLGFLLIDSANGNGVSAKDDLSITGGTYSFTTSKDAFEANDSILIFNGDFTIISGNDAFHSENEDDTTLGFIYIQNGTMSITAADDAIHGTTIVQIDGGVITIDSCTEGIEGTYIQINSGTITIASKDDGINATNKSNYDVVIEVNGGTIDVTMASGDTDGFDANGNIIINGGTISVTAVSAFDADGSAVLNGGDVTVNGEKIIEIVQQQMGRPGGQGIPAGGKRH